MSKILIFLINSYQKYISKYYFRPTCIFFPSCSEYTKEAVIKYGAFKGMFLGFKRIFKCHPFNTPRIDKLN